jgi:sugar phosphate isomerase/epimerase
MMISRREFVTGAAAVIATGVLARSVSAADSTTSPATQPLRYKIAACDWMMLKRQTTGAITRAKQCGCDGVETDMGSLGKKASFTNQFQSDPNFAQKYLATCRDNGIEISSIAMSGFYAQPFAARPIDWIEQPAKDTIATMKMLNVKRAFLPLGVGGDLIKNPENRPTIVDRLKRIGAMAQEAGVIIGIETALDSSGNAKLLEDVGSDAIRIYFNFQNPLAQGRDLCEELKILGKDRICQIHCTNGDEFWLQDDPAIDMPKVKRTLDEMGWSGWLVIERSRKKDRPRDVVGNFSANAKFLKSIFQAA